MPAKDPFEGDVGLGRVLAAMQLKTDEDAPTIEELEMAMAEVPDSIIMLMDDPEVLNFLGKFGDRTTLFWRSFAGDMNTPYVPQGGLQ